MKKLGNAPANSPGKRSSRTLVAAVAAATCLGGGVVYLALDDAPQSVAVSVVSQPAQRGWGDSPSGSGVSPFGALVSPFGALSCGPSGGLLGSSTACNPDQPAEDEKDEKDEISTFAGLRNVLAALSASDIDPIYQINRALAECILENGVAGAEPSTAKSCDVAGAREVVDGVEAALSTIQSTPKGREAMLDWLVHWEQLEYRIGSQDGEALKRLSPQTAASADGKQLRLRLRTYLEKLEPRDEYAQSVLDRLNEEDALATAPAEPEEAES